MNKILTPLISANEDLATIVSISIKQNSFYKKDKIICILETSKSSVDVNLEKDGFVYLLHNEGDEVKAGEVLGLVSDKKIEKDLIDKSISSKSSKLNKSYEVETTIKAKEMLKKYRIDAQLIKKTGVIKSSDVEKYLKDKNIVSSDHKIDKNEKEKNNNLINEYEKFEKIMKMDNFDGIKLEDVEKLKKTFLLAEYIYRKKWNRSIPTIDSLFDRWKNAEKYSKHEKTNVSHLSYIIGDVKIGKQTFVGPYTFLDGGGELIIGDYTSIATGVHIYSHDNISRALSGYNQPTTKAKTTIGNCCFIGPNAVITKGVTIGDHCFIGANSVITFDVPSYSAIAGNPGTKIGKVEIKKDGKVIISKRDVSPKFSKQEKDLS